MTHTPRSPCPFPLRGPHLVPGRARVRRAQGGGGSVVRSVGCTVLVLLRLSMRKDTGLDEATQRRTAVDTAEKFAFRRRAAGRGGCSPSKCARAESPSCATQPCGRTTDRGGGKRGRTDCDQPPPNTPLANARSPSVGGSVVRGSNGEDASVGRAVVGARARAPPRSQPPKQGESLSWGARSPSSGVPRLASVSNRAEQMLLSCMAGFGVCVPAPRDRPARPRPRARARHRARCAPSLAPFTSVRVKGRTARRCPPPSFSSPQSRDVDGRARAQRARAGARSRARSARGPSPTQKTLQTQTARTPWGSWRTKTVSFWRARRCAESRMW